MNDSFQPLLRHAFREGPAEEANSLIDEVRRQVSAEWGRACNYEVLLTGRSWTYVSQVVAPRLALFLRSKRLSVRSCGSVFLSLFLGDRLYFLGAEDFYRGVRLAEGWSDEAFAALARTWEETGRAAAGALPPGPSGKPS
jgi:hypothetical protein